MAKVIATHENLSVVEFDTHYEVWLCDPDTLMCVASAEMGDGVDRYRAGKDGETPVYPGTGEFEIFMQEDLENNYQDFLDAYFPGREFEKEDDDDNS